MRDKRLNLKWAAKLTASKSFVVLTDKESVIALEGIDPNKLSDMLVLQAQQASIDAFLKDLTALKKAHERRVEELGGRVGVTKKRATAKKAKSSSKRNRS